MPSTQRLPRRPAPPRWRSSPPYRDLWRTLLAIAVLAAALPAPGQVRVEKYTPRCSPRGCVVYNSPSVATLRYYVTVTNETTSFLEVRVVDDIPPEALGFLVVDRSDGQPCGAPGNPVCSNVPAPGGAHGNGQVVVDGITLGRSGSLLSSKTVTIEIDVSCPPITTGHRIENQAFVYTPLDPTLCNPCPSNLEVSSMWCVPAPEFTVTKTPTTTVWRPGMSRDIGYTIEITNASTLDPIIGSEMSIFDKLPIRPDHVSAFDAAMDCPIDMTDTPPVGVAVDALHCEDMLDPYLFAQRFVDVPPGDSFQLHLRTTMLDGFLDGFDYCNETWVYYTPTGAVANARACTLVQIPQDVNFRASVKSVVPEIATPGAGVYFEIAVRNTGTQTATGVVLTDVIESCIDDSNFDPATDVRVNPGPASGPITYLGRTLTVPLPDMPSGSTQSVIIDRLRAGDPICCNQAVLTANELAAPGHRTGGPSGPGDRTCYGPRAVNFSGSTKTVTPDPLVAGEPLVYTITAGNSGAIAANEVVVDDVLPDCIDDAAFNPALDITVTPGPADLISYQPVGRLLRVGFVQLAPFTAQTIEVRGLKAGPVTASCCNQAFLSSREVPPVGDPTSHTPGLGDPTCAAIVAPVGCDLNKATAALGSPRTPPWLYTNGCAAPARLPGPPFVADVPADADIDAVAGSLPGGEISLYQLDCPCASAIYLTKNTAVTPAAVHIRF